MWPTRPPSVPATPVRPVMQLGPRTIIQLLKPGCQQWFKGDVKSIDAECMCHKSGKKKVCNGEVSVKGQHKKDSGLRWLFAIALPVHISGVVLPLGYVTYLNCNLPQVINPVLAPWTQKGL